MGAVGLVTAIQLGWINAENRDLAMTEVWRSLTNDLDTADLIQSVPVNAPGALQRWTDDGLTPGETWYYWIRHRNRTGLASTYIPDTPLAGWEATVLETTFGIEMSPEQSATIMARIALRV